MKVKALIFAVCILAISSPAQTTYSHDLNPSTTGYNLGMNVQRWNAFIQNLDIAGQFKVPILGYKQCLEVGTDGIVHGTRAACGSGGGGGNSDDVISGKTPHADIRAHGAICDGSTDDTAALQAAATALNNNGGVIYIPGPTCYIADPTSITWRTSGVGAIKLEVQGMIKLGSTFIMPPYFAINCLGGAYPGQFTMAGPNCAFTAPNAKGTLGATITAGNGKVITPAFTSGTIANIKVGSWLTIGGTTSCTISSISRDSTGIVTATLSASQCRIPPGAYATVTGVGDSTFNVNPTVLTSDYPAGVMTWKQNGQSSASSTGGTITGFNDDTFETVPVTDVTGANVTINTTHAHDSGDKFGVVAVSTTQGNFGTMSIHGLNVYTPWGAAFYMPQSTNITFDGISSSAQSGWFTSIPLYLDSAYGFHISHSSFMTSAPGASCSNGAVNCGEQSYPWGVKMSIDKAGNAATASGVIDGNTTIAGGIKVDCNTKTGGACAISGSVLRDLIIEQPNSSAILIDPRGLGSQNTPWTIDSVFLQDRFNPYTICLIGYTDPPSTATGGLIATNMHLSDLSDCLTNKYFSGRISVNGVDGYNGTMNLPHQYGLPTGTILDGRTIEGEIRGVNAGMAPSIIPSATSNVTIDPASWTCTGSGCSITTGVLAPDGTATAGELVRGSAGAKIQVAGNSLATATGDWIIMGVWMRPGANFTGAIGTAGGPTIQTYSANDIFDDQSITWDSSVTAQFGSAYAGDWWAPIVAARKITGAGGSSHQIQMFLENGLSTSGMGILYWNPFFMLVPHTLKPSDWSEAQWDAEIARWRQQLLHGAVPPNMPAGVLAMNTNHKLYWGSDTNLFRVGAGIVKTDGSFDVGVGYKCQGSYGSSGQLLSTTGSGCSWINPPATSPLTTKGDLYGYSTTNARVPVGTDGQCLIADSTQTLGLVWGSCGGSTFSAPIQVNDGALTRIDMTKQSWGTPNAKGAYSGATAYVANDAVTSSGVHYIAIASTTGNAPPNATYWAVLLPSGYDAATYIGGDGAQHCYLGSTQGSCAPSGLKCSAAAQGALDDGSTDNVAILTAAQSTCTGGIIFTQVLGSGYKLASNFTATVPLFMDGGYFVVPTGVTLTINGAFQAPYSQVFSTSGTGAVKFGTTTDKVYAEWWGAKGDWNGSTGTDDHAALQAGLDSLSAGSHLHLLNKSYYVGTTTLNIGSSHPDATGIVGVESRSYGPNSYIINSSATNTIMAVAGASAGSRRNNTLIKNVGFTRTAAPSGTAKGLSLAFTFYAEVNNVASTESLSNIYLNEALDTRVFHSFAGLTLGGTGCGFCVDTSTGPSYSTYFVDDFAYSSGGANHLKGFHIFGAAINDLFFTNPETATVDYGMYFDTTGSATFSTGDIHITDPVIDSCYQKGLYFNGVGAAPKNAHIDIKGGWIGCPGAAKQIDLNSSYGISMIGTHVINGSSGDAVYVTGGGSNSFIGMHIATEGNGITLNATNNNKINDNTIQGSYSTGTPSFLITLLGADKNGIAGNTLYCTTNTCTDGIKLDATSDNNAVGTNSIDGAKITNQVNNSTGAGNGPGNILVAKLTTTAATSDTVTLTGMNANGTCTLTPTNSSAAGDLGAGTVYVSKTTDQITVTHANASGETFDIHCSQF